MKKNSFVAALLVVALVAVTVSVSASGGPPGGGFYSGQTLQNIGTGISSVIVDLYDSASSVKYTTSFTIPVGGARTFFSSDVPGIPSAFQGSAIVSSDEPLKAIVNVTNRQSGSNGIAGGTAAAQYNGLGTENTGTTVSFPLAKGGFGVKTTAFYIQNAGSAPATFTASFLMGTGLSDPSPVAYSYTSPSLAPGQMAAIIPSDAGVPAGRIGSLSVTSAQPLAGTVLEYETTTAPAKILQGTTGFTPSDYDTRILFPVMKKALGSRSTGLQVQNVDAASVGVTMVYYGAGGTCPSGTFTETVRTLAPKQSTTYLDPAILPAGCLATAAATGTGLIAGVVNEAYIPAVPAGQYQRATTYSAFPAKTATIKVVAPVLSKTLAASGLA